MFASDHDHDPDRAAMKLIAQAFADAPVSNPDGTTGINLHIDCGPDCIMNPKTNDRWGSKVYGKTVYSKAAAIIETADLQILGDGPPCSPATPCLDAAFALLKSSYFLKNAPERVNVFHYAVFGHQHPEPAGKCRSGLSRGIPASDFIVTLGCSPDKKGDLLIQAGTFMHELGHNLGIRHGGIDDTHNKPNYLSVMNYSFQSGLLTDWFLGIRKVFFDYSRFSHIPVLDENGLSSSGGINGGATVNGLWTKYVCPTNHPLTGIDWSDPIKAPLVRANDSISWNCSEPVDPRANVNGDFDTSTGQPIYSSLTSYNDWARLVFTGGSIGGSASGIDLVSFDDMAKSGELPTDELWAQRRDGARVLADKQISTIGKGQSTTIWITVDNLGDVADTYGISRETNSPFVDFSAIPSTVTLNAKTSSRFSINVIRPLSGTYDVITIKIGATSHGFDWGTVDAKIFPLGDVNHDGAVNIDDLNLLQKELNKSSTEFTADYDLNSDGKIDAVDARLLVNECTKPRCAK
jgi:hypothetical protein